MPLNKYFSDLFLERALRGELSAAEQKEFDVARQNDDSLRARLNEKKRARNLWQAQDVPSWLSNEIKQTQMPQKSARTKKRWAFSEVLFSKYVMSGALCACLAVVGWRISQTSEVNPYRVEQTATKGRFADSVKLSIYRVDDGAAEAPLVDNTVIKPGVHIRFVVETSKAGYLHVMNDDGNDQVMLQFLTASGETQTAVELSEGEYNIPQSIDITEQGTYERFHAFVCQHAYTLADFSDSIPKDCLTDQVTLQKGP